MQGGRDATHFKNERLSGHFQERDKKLRSHLKSITTEAKSVVSVSCTGQHLSMITRPSLKTCTIKYSEHSLN
ncbi:unnamed protein product [Allacma fusca]|uniref:Uncharacterized protein n=1 Tax=Allacma fusca TaxID=39272 RepID=A0A8J2LK41_9HEXA|nr:unnamed protein product [Allacma fusca]